MSDDLLLAMILPKANGFSSEKPIISGILINRDPPITTGWCGNDTCEHATHKARRVAQASADKRANK